MRYSLIVLLAIFILTGCLGPSDKGGVDGKGFAGRKDGKETLAEFVSKFPAQVEGEEVFCRSLDETIELPLNALNPSIPLLPGSPQLDIVASLNNPQSQRTIDFKLRTEPQQGLLVTDAKSSAMGKYSIVYSSPAKFGENYLVLNARNNVLGDYFFGYAVASAFGNGYKSNLLCRTSANVKSHLLSLNHYGEELKTYESRMKEIHNTPLVNPREIDPSLNGSWKSVCLEAGFDMSRKLSISVEESGKVRIETSLFDDPFCSSILIHRKVFFSNCELGELESAQAFRCIVESHALIPYSSHIPSIMNVDQECGKTNYETGKEMDVSSAFCGNVSQKGESVVFFVEWDGLSFVFKPAFIFELYSEEHHSIPLQRF